MSPRSHISLSCLIRKKLHVPNSSPIIFGNKVKFSTFFIAWSKSLCWGPIFLEVASQNYQPAKTGRLFTSQQSNHVGFSRQLEGAVVAKTWGMGHSSSLLPRPISEWNSWQWFTAELINTFFWPNKPLMQAPQVYLVFCLMQYLCQTRLAQYRIAQISHTCLNRRTHHILTHHHGWR